MHNMYNTAIFCFHLASNNETNQETWGRKPCIIGIVSAVFCMYILGLLCQDEYVRKSRLHLVETL